MCFKIHRKSLGAKNPKAKPVNQDREGRQAYYLLCAFQALLIIPFANKYSTYLNLQSIQPSYYK